jgi:hypothetical protein
MGVEMTEEMVIRKRLQECNYIEAYHDYHGGELERYREDIDQLQRALTALVVLLVRDYGIDLDAFLNEV